MKSSQEYDAAEDIRFSRELIKGRIAEIIFEQMLRLSEKFTILRFGYEYTLPEISQYQQLAEVKAVLQNIRNAPDFILVSQDKKEVYLVEVKYRKTRLPQKTKEIAQKLLQTWNPSWLFIASPDGFFFDPCHTVVNNNGEMERLYTTWVSHEVQQEYLQLLNEFETGHP